jgi:hypothetical protein
MVICGTWIPKTASSILTAGYERMAGCRTFLKLDHFFLILAGDNTYKWILGFI